VVGRVSDVLTFNNKYVEYQRMRKMINKQIGVSLIALTLVVVSLFTATAITNVYADSYKQATTVITDVTYLLKVK
jgi:hypothetical protein